MLLDGNILDVRNAPEARRRLGIEEAVPPDLSGYVRTTDPRLTDARTPTAHAATHEAGGSDELDVTGLRGVLAEPQRTRWTVAEIDFGSDPPAYNGVFTVVDPAVTPTSVVAVTPCGQAATGRTADDWQWDGLTLAAEPAAGLFRLHVAAVPGPVVGPRRIQYQVF